VYHWEQKVGEEKAGGDDAARLAVYVVLSKSVGNWPSQDPVNE